jgi:hypothetical protein
MHQLLVVFNFIEWISPSVPVSILVHDALCSLFALLCSMLAKSKITSTEIATCEHE